MSETSAQMPYGFGIRPVMPKCKSCGKFCGIGAATFRSYDWQGTPIEDYVLCRDCQPKNQNETLSQDTNKAS